VPVALKQQVNQGQLARNQPGAPKGLLLQESSGIINPTNVAAVRLEVQSVSAPDHHDDPRKPRRSPARVERDNDGAVEGGII
jgi:hypothetical protein